MTLPSLLLQRFNNTNYRGNIDDEDDNEEEEVEELVTELLHSASQLSPWTSRESVLGPMSNYFHDEPKYENDKSDCPNSYEWLCTFELLQMILFPGSNHEKPLIQGHLLLRLVQEVVPLANECTTGGDLPTLQYLCLLLSCEAIHIEIRSTSKRWRRFQSMCCETIALFQRSLAPLVVLLNNSQDCHASFMRCMNFTSIVFYKHFVPAIRNAVSEMSQSEVSNKYMERAIVTGFVRIALLLGKALNEVSTFVNDEHSKKQVHSMILRLSASIQDMLGLELDVLLMYPHLVYKESTLYKSALQNDCCLRSLLDIQPFIEEFLPLICIGSDDGESYDFDTFCGMDTTWELVSLTTLVLSIFQEDSSYVSSSLQSEMNQPEIYFELFFPLVEIFLEHEVEGEESPYQSLLRSYYYETGFGWLRKLLEKEPKLGKSTSLIAINVMDSNLNPIDVMQVLFNSIISLSSIQNQSRTGVDQEAIQDIFILLRKLLSVYDICHQISIVKVLLHRCPFPSLIPTIIDMLRPTVPLIDDNELTCSDLVSTIYEFLEEMTSCTTVDDFTKLLENAEIYSSAVSLLSLASKLRKTTVFEALGDLYPKLVNLQKNLTAHLTSWVKDDENATNQRFRLWLLESSLQMLLD